MGTGWRGDVRLFLSGWPLRMCKLQPPFLQLAACPIFLEVPTLALNPAWLMICP